MIPVTKDAYKLFHDGALAFANVEANGMRIDVSRLEQTIVKVREKIGGLQSKMKDDPVYDVWKKRFGRKTNLGSRPQLGTVLTEELGFEIGDKTGTGRIQVSESVLEKLDSLFTKRLLKVEKLKQLLNTFLRGVRREVEGEYIHPSFNLNTVRTYRSSCNDPNFQNIPIRDPRIGKLIRRCFIPRDGHVIVEIDYGGVEVCVAALYNHDPALIAYIEDKTKDMHRDMAAECYLCEPEEVSKSMRQTAKSGFVFPEFYGSYFVECATNLWEAIDTESLAVGDVIPLHDWLTERGIDELGAPPTKGKPFRPPEGTFFRHVRGVENQFWNHRFQRYAQWKREWYAEYQKTGGFQLLTGFREEGYFKRNDVTNHPIQGVAFHLLLWSLIQMNRWLVQNKMKSVIVGQIHDSIVADVHLSELDDYLAMAKQVMTVDVRRHWPWIIVPLEVDAEVCPEGGSWFDKKEVAI